MKGQNLKVKNAVADIFLGYAREDAKVTRELALALEELDWTVFWDIKLKAGQRWREAILKELEAARCVVILWSRSSVQEHRRWVMQEAEVAREANKLVTAHIDQVNPPFGYTDLHSSNLVGWRRGVPNVEFDGLASGIMVLIDPGHGVIGMNRELAEAISHAVGDIRRFESQGHFAAYAGVVPGHPSPFNGRLRDAIMDIAIAQRDLPGSGRSYYERKKRVGRTDQEALLALARQVSRAVYRHLHSLNRG